MANIILHYKDAEMMALMNKAGGKRELEAELKKLSFMYILNDDKAE